jgi:hypothetical protein
MITPTDRPRRPKGVPGRLRPRIYLTFGTTRAVGRQPHAPAAFTFRRNTWYSFLEADSTPGHMVPSVVTEKIPSVTPPGIDTETFRLVAQCLNHYATPGPKNFLILFLMLFIIPFFGIIVITTYGNNSVTTLFVRRGLSPFLIFIVNRCLMADV